MLEIISLCGYSASFVPFKKKYHFGYNSMLSFLIVNLADLHTLNWLGILINYY